MYSCKHWIDFVTTFVSLTDKCLSARNALFQCMFSMFPSSDLCHTIGELFYPNTLHLNFLKLWLTFLGFYLVAYVKLRSI